MRRLQRATADINNNVSHVVQFLDNLNKWLSFKHLQKNQLKHNVVDFPSSSCWGNYALHAKMVVLKPLGRFISTPGQMIFHILLLLEKVKIVHMFLWCGHFCCTGCLMDNGL